MHIDSQFTLFGVLDLQLPEGFVWLMTRIYALTPRPCGTLLLEAGIPGVAVFDLLP
jgi:hypothetical protein